MINVKIKMFSHQYDKVTFKFWEKINHNPLYVNINDMIYNYVLDSIIVEIKLYIFRDEV